MKKNHSVAHALLRAVSALVPTRCSAAERRDESRRGTHECVRHSTASTGKLTLVGGPLPPVGRPLRVEFLWRIRDEIAFDSPQALKAQILKDARTAQNYFRRAQAWIGRPERPCS